MRDYQTKSNVGGGADSIVSTKFGAGEFNSLATENENAVLRAGLTLAPANGSGEVTTQLAQSLFLHGVKAAAFQDGGSAGVYELTPVSGASGVLLPGDYDNMSGARITFSPGADNTGASTVNIGQTSGALLGAKPLLTSSGSALSGGEVMSGGDVTIVYDAAADGGDGAWLLSTAVATQTARGLIELATGAEAQGLADGVRALTPLTLDSAFKGANQSVIETGYQRLPGGLILQWGVAQSDDTGPTINFPLAFPNVCFAMMSGDAAVSADPTVRVHGFEILSSSQFRFWGESGAGSHSAFYLAVGH